MLTKEQMSILDKQYGQACADNKLKTPWEGVRWAAEWGINSATSEIARLEAAINNLCIALRDLYDEQNDAPLERRRPQWEAAMKNAIETLKLYEK